MNGHLLLSILARNETIHTKPNQTDGRSSPSEKREMYKNAAMRMKEILVKLGKSDKIPT